MIPISRQITRGLLRTLWIVALLVLGVFFLYKIKTLFVYLLLALVLTLVGNPIVSFLKERLRFSKTLAVAVTLLLFLSLLLGFLYLLYPLISTQVENVSQEGFKHFEDDFNALLLDIQNTLNSFGFNFDFTSTNPLSKFITEEEIGLLLNNLLTFIGNFIVGLGATFFITFFFLRDKAIFIYQFKKFILPDDHTDKIMITINKIENLLSRYFLGLSIQLLIFGFVCYLALVIVGVKSAVIIALISALLNIVPYIGPLIANVIAALFTLLTFIDDDFSSVALPKAITISIAYIVIQFIDNNFLQPYIFSNSVKSHPLEIFLVILVFSFLGGVFGMIIAVPFYTSLKVILKEFMPENRIIRLFTKDI